MSLRFAAVISHPIQHYSPVFRELAKVPGLEVKVFYCCDWGVRATFDPGFNRAFAWDVPLLEGHDYEFVPMRHPPRDMSFWQVDNPALAERLGAFAPHALWVHGYGHRSCWRALHWARGRCAVLYFGDSELLHHRGLAARLAKSLVVRYFFRRCDAFLTIGDNNEAYYAYYGVPREKMFRGACPVDVGRFLRVLAEPGRPSRAALRQRFGLPPDAVVALFAAKMIPIKRPQDLVEAVALLRPEGVPLAALLVGDGPLRADLERRVRDAGLEDWVRFAGFVNQREIPLVLDCADVLAMTSEKDPHPLAVTESMIVGHPVVASDRVGCVGPTDSARPGVNALVYPCGDVPALARALRALVEDARLRSRMSEASRALAPTQDVAATVDAVLRALLALRPRFQHAWRDVGPEVFELLEAHRHHTPDAALSVPGAGAAPSLSH